MTVFGIDLGTCYSCIARDDGAGSVMPIELLDNRGKLFVPSVVTFDSTTGRPKVGNAGKACMFTKPECTKAFVKREMDREFCESEITIAGVRRQLSPVEASACILKHLFEGANKVETNAGRPRVEKAVITVPAKFNEQQRARTKLAAEMAGIDVLGLLQEPTAAAIAYNIPAGKTVLVFDLGGGTLDVSIVTNDRGNYKVVGTPAGDSNLGGMDWDERLIELAFQKVGKRTDKSDAKKWNRLMGRAEKIKMALTDDESIIDDEVEEGNIIEDAEVEIERSEFETKCKDLLDRCWIIVDQAIANAKQQSPGLNIDFFLTVGGSSRMPMIKKGIISRYGSVYGRGKSENDWLRIHEPDKAIAIGAAKYAQILSHDSLSANRTTSDLKAIEDKATHSYGLGILKDEKSAIINLVKASDPIVYNKSFDNLSTSCDGSSISITIYEDDSTEDYIDIDSSTKIIMKRSFNLSKKIAKGTPVGLSINRDKDGLINIVMTCDNDKITLEVNPSATLINPETRANIKKSLSLMN